MLLLFLTGNEMFWVIAFSVVGSFLKFINLNCNFNEKSSEIKKEVRGPFNELLTQIVGRVVLAIVAGYLVGLVFGRFEIEFVILGSFFAGYLAPNLFTDLENAIKPKNLFKVLMQIV